MRSTRCAARAVLLLGLGALAGAAQGVVIMPGTYLLHNHPDGDVVPPSYGMRLDGLYSGSPAEFTLDFDDPMSNMHMDVTATSIHIYGVAYGGRDIGGSYAAEATTGVYTVDFLYNVGVGMVPGDDDMYVVAPMGSNFGSLLTPTGDLLGLADKPDAYNFRLGDEDDDLGHRGFAGISGWGWFTIDSGRPNTGAVDFLFTAELVPAPGAVSLLGMGGVLAGTRRRR